MSDTIEALSSLPLFSDLSTSDIEALLKVFEKRILKEGEVLFEEGSIPSAVFLLVAGSVSVKSGDEEVLVASSPSAIGELSAMTGEDRSTTAIATSQIEVLAAPVDKLQAFLEENGSIGYRFQRTMLRLAARKIGRDRSRIREMRTNIVSTQKVMKSMRDALLQSEDSALHASLFEELDARIEHNRRIHYLVEPSRLVPTQIRLSDGVARRVTAISNEWVYFENPPQTLKANEEFTGVLLLDGDEVPVIGTVDQVSVDHGVAFLDELVPDYLETLSKHLMRAQMLDVVL